MPTRLLYTLALLTTITLVPATRAQNYAEHFGISIGAPVYNGQVTFTEQVAQDLREIGVRWIRVEFIANGDTLPYHQYDEIVSRANAYDLEVLGLLTYQTKWYSGNSSFWANDNWQDSFRDRCVEIVNHYKDFPGGGIKFWEIWNEPDSLGYMPPAKFGRMLSICYPAIKAADPQATIVLGGLTGYWTPTYTYMREVYRSSYFADYHNANGIYPFDIMGQHPYDWTNNPDDYLDLYMNALYGMRRLMTLYGDEYKRIWFTEYGWNSSPTANSSINPGGTVVENEFRQADYFEIGFDITQRLDYGDGFGPYAEKTFLFCYKDFDLGTPQTRELFGVVTQGFERKPNFFRHRDLTENALNNAALTATVAASAELAPDEVAAFACDGTPFTKWTALAPADDHYLTLDLNRWYLVSEFRLAHAELNHETDQFNTLAFAIQSAPTAAGPWTTVASVTNPAPAPINIIELPDELLMRHVRLHITDAGTADGIARLPEFEVLGRPLDEFADVTPAYELAPDLSGPNGLTEAIAADDLVANQAAAFEGGDVDPDNYVTAYDFDASDCLSVDYASPVTGFWSGYGDPSPAAHVGKLTDGSAADSVVLRDFAQASAVLRYDFSEPTDLRKVAVFAANPAKDGRVFQHYDAYVSTDGGAGYELLARSVRTGDYGLVNNGEWGASLTTLTAPVTGTLVADATNLRLVFYNTHIGNMLHDPWQGTRYEGTSYQGTCPDYDPQDRDGLRKAFAAPILLEIDVFERLAGDGNADGLVNAVDFAELDACLFGPDVAGPAPLCRPFDFPQRDGHVGQVDVARFQSAIE